MRVRIRLKVRVRVRVKVRIRVRRQQHALGYQLAAVGYHGIDVSTGMAPGFVVDSHAAAVLGSAWLPQPCPAL